MKWNPDLNPCERRRAAWFVVPAVFCCVAALHSVFHWRDSPLWVAALIVADIGIVGGLVIAIRARKRVRKASGRQYPLFTRSSALWAVLLVALIVAGFVVIEHSKGNV